VEVLGPSTTDYVPRSSASRLCKLKTRSDVGGNGQVGNFGNSFSYLQNQANASVSRDYTTESWHGSLGGQVIKSGGWGIQQLVYPYHTAFIFPV